MTNPDLPDGKAGCGILLTYVVLLMIVVFTVRGLLFVVFGA